MLVQVDMKLWVEDENLETLRSIVVVGKYVRIYGNVRSINGNQSVIAFNARPVTDFNEVQFSPTSHLFFLKTSMQEFDPVVDMGLPFVFPPYQYLHMYLLTFGFDR